MFYRYKDESRYFHEKTLLNFSTVTVTKLIYPKEVGVHRVGFHCNYTFIMLKIISNTSKKIGLQ